MGCDFLELAESPIGDDRQSFIEEIKATTLLRSDLNDPSCLFLNLADKFTLVDGKVERFFAVRVFSGQHCFDQNLRMPVVRS